MSSINAEAEVSTLYDVSGLGGYRPEQLLESCLSPEQLAQGWVRLYDGVSTMGWFFVGTADWASKDGAITVESGEPSLLCTSFQIGDYELLVDFNCPEGTNSGIFLRTTADPQDVERDCYELNIAPKDDPFPTGSLVKRQQVQTSVAGVVEPNAWHTYRIIVQGDEVQVWLDGQQVIEYTDPRKLRRGYIALQHNKGTVRFRNILMRPLGTEAITTSSDWEAAWNKIEKSGETLTVQSSEDGLRLTGGPGQLESKGQWDDFVLQAVYRTATPEVDSGILFRCLPGQLDAGYECQILHAAPAESSKKIKHTGWFSIPARRPGEENDDVRAIVGDGTVPTHITIIAEESQFVAWVNGLQVAEASDTRDTNDNPRLGSRRAGGPIALQAAKQTTDIQFSRISIAPIAK
ncbi:MAG: DUF1080 domain-containing protein [Pirellulaceae bacterium]|nr:DUF1080 domain-containing protein [Pirellulaceae bacterium]